MTVDQYFARMKRLGYPCPSLMIWDDDGKITASASFKGSCGHGGRVRGRGEFVGSYDQWIAHVFEHVTDGGKTFAERQS